MPVAFSHLFRLVPHPLVDDALIDTGRGQVEGEGMAEDMETFDLFPAAPVQRSAEVITDLRSCQKTECVAFFTAHCGQSWADRELTAGMYFEPFRHGVVQQAGHQKMPKGHRFRSAFLFLSNLYRPGSEIEIVDLRAEHLATSSPSVADKDKHWENERKPGRQFRVLKSIFDLRGLQETGRTTTLPPDPGKVRLGPALLQSPPMS